jgi:hypothetical protein
MNCAWIVGGIGSKRLASGAAALIDDSDFVVTDDPNVKQQWLE